MERERFKAEVSGGFVGAYPRHGQAIAMPWSGYMAMPWHGMTIGKPRYQGVLGQRFCHTAGNHGAHAVDYIIEGSHTL